jgi:DNA-binding transcriptional LysR family regulator
MDSEIFRSFVTIAETGSFTETARRIGRTQSAVTQQIRKLEDALRRPLFRRGSGLVTLTEHGQRLMPHARAIVSAQDAALAAFDLSELTGTVSLGLPETYAQYLIPRILPGFRALYPNVTIDLSFTNSLQLLRHLEGGALDLSFVTDVEAPDAVGPVVLRDEVVWVAPKAAAPELETPLPIVVWREGTAYRRVTIERLRAQGRDVRIAVSTESIGGMIVAVSAGLGIAALTRSVTPSSLRTLTREAGMPDMPILKVRLVRAKERKNRLVDRLHDHILEVLGDGVIENGPSAEI